MTTRIILRAAAAPLTPAHVACFLGSHTGFDRDAARWMDDIYYSVAKTALTEAIANDKTFQTAIAGLVYSATQKAVSRLNPVQQFLALAKELSICPASSDGLPHGLAGNHAVITAMLERPFVIGYDSIDALEALRVSEPDPSTTRMKLEGFVEANIGAVGILGIE